MQKTNERKNNIFTCRFKHKHTAALPIQRFEDRLTDDQRYLSVFKLQKQNSAVL